MRYKALITQIIIIALSLSFITTLFPNRVFADTDISGDLAKYCDYAGGNAACTKCATVDKGVWTAIGCIPATPQGLFEKVFSLGVGVAGGISFLLILFGGFQILVSAGNPEQLNEGQELISSAVAGLLLIIFSVFLLKLIGYDILRIPGFGT